MAERKPLFVGAFGAEEVNPTSDSITLAGLAISSAAGIDMNGNKITELGTPTLATDAANKQYVDSVAVGLDFKQSVRLATIEALPANTAAGSGIGKTLTGDVNGALSVDNIPVAVGNRILVKDESPATDNGVYTVTVAGDGSTKYVLTRTSDFDENSEVTAGTFMFVTEGDTLADTGWVLTTNDPITVDGTGLVFAQFSSATPTTGGAGILKSGAAFDVELDTLAGAQTTGADGGSSGLEFDITGASGKLRAKVDPAGGIQRLAAGLALEIDDSPNTLDVDADGLKVVGLPLQFYVNDAAVSTSVTAANLNTLVAGIASSADALHRHGKLEQACNVDAAVNAGDPVYYSSADEVSKADAAGGVGTGQRVIGVARTAQAVIGSPTEVVRSGPCAGVLSGAAPGAPYWLASGGGLTATAPTGNVDRVLVGYAINGTDLDVRIQYMGKTLA